MSKHNPYFSRDHINYWWLVFSLTSQTSLLKQKCHFCKIHGRKIFSTQSLVFLFQWCSLFLFHISCSKDSHGSSTSCPLPDIMCAPVISPWLQSLISSWKTARKGLVDINTWRPGQNVWLCAWTKTVLFYEFNSSWSSVATWWHRSRSTLAQVMACCLTAPSHYLS